MITFRLLRDTLTPALRNIQTAFSPASIHRLNMAMGQAFVDMTRANFGTSGRYRGKPWPKLSPAYARRLGSSVPTLMRSGKLKASIIMKQPTRGFVEIYTQNPYAQFHTFGSKKMPARVFWPAESNGDRMWRLQFAADREMNALIAKRLNIQSRGALPLLPTSALGRMPFQFGNMKTGAS